MKYILASALIVCALAACKSKKENVAVATPPPTPQVVETPKPAADSVLITYQRTPCFGMCPVFNLTVHQSGKAQFEGKNFTDMIGFYQSQMDAAALQRIAFVADSIGYFSMDDKYDYDKVTDLPTTTTAILKNGTLKSVANRYKGPKSLLVLYKELDAFIASAKWTPRTNN
jgi:hypothetical protein